MNRPTPGTPRPNGRLKRDIAIKVLPQDHENDPERLARFQREAELLATVNHPNIAAIYGLEKTDGISAIVLELVDGDTLADIIARGPIPLDEALAVARQVANALEAAHERGVIHRDLKPANIKLTPDGTVKVLDFGLAKMLESSLPAGANAGATNSPTITPPAMTMAGAILGTAAYMAPEQAKGRSADQRSDVWAFGCVHTYWQGPNRGRNLSGRRIAVVLDSLNRMPSFPSSNGSISTAAQSRSLRRSCRAPTSVDRGTGKARSFSAAGPMLGCSASPLKVVKLERRRD